MVKLNFNLAKLSIHKDLRFDKRAFTMLFERIPRKGITLLRDLCVLFCHLIFKDIIEDLYHFSFLKNILPIRQRK